MWLCSFAGGPPFYLSRTDESDLLGGVICERVSDSSSSLAAKAFRSFERLLGKEL